MYQIELRHDGLNKYRVITGRFQHIVEEKARVQKAAWDEMWERQDKRKALLYGKALKKETAAAKTAECERAILQNEETLVSALAPKAAFDWEQLKSHTSFEAPYPVKQNYPEPPRQPLTTDKIFTPVLGLLDWLLPSRRRLELRRTENLFKEHHQEWEKAQHAFEREIASIDRRFEQQRKVWKQNKDTFEANQRASNLAIDTLHAKYDAGDISAIKEYCDIILDISSYPDQFPKDWDMEFDENTGIFQNQPRHKCCRDRMGGIRTPDSSNL